MASSDRSRSKSAGSHLDTQVSYRLGAPLVYVKGEIDHDTAGHLREVIEQELTENPPVLILEFSELAYMDSGGLSLMFDTVQRFRDSGWLGVVATNQGVRRLLEITGLADHARFRLLPDLAAASAALAAETDMQPA